jgi:serine/threonine-protein kinase
MTDPPTCPGPDELGRFLAGRLDAAAAEVVARHLHGCDRCLGTAAAVDRHDPGLADIARGWEALAPPLEPGDLDELIGSVKALRDDVTPWADPTATPAPGEVGSWGPFEVLKVLGTGGMGVVLLARKERPRRLVAVKVMAGELNGEGQDRFRAEADAVARLRHPNVVQVHEVGEHRGRPYFVMEYVEGGTWPRDWPPRRPLPARPRRWSRRWRGPSSTPTSAACCTATSSRPTSC